MPKTLWLPGGRGGGGHRETFYTAQEVRDLSLAAEARGRETERRRNPNLQSLILDGYTISRPAQNPCPKAPETAVERVRWWETIDSTTSFFVTVVVAILIILAFALWSGVAW